MSFYKKKIKFTIQKPTGKIEITGYRATVFISDYLNARSTANIQIYGLKKATISSIRKTKFEKAQQTTNDTLLIEAINDSGQFVQIFKGDIVLALPNFENATMYLMNITAISCSPTALGVLPMSVGGKSKVIDILEDLANKSGLEFNCKNKDEFQEVVTDLCENDTPSELIRKLCEQFSINYNMGNGKLTILPKEDPSKTNQDRNEMFKFITPQTGLIGYPQIQNYDDVVTCTVLYDDWLTYGCLVNLQSSLDWCNGFKRVYKADIILESETHNGKWFANLTLGTNIYFGGK